MTPHRMRGSGGPGRHTGEVIVQTAIRSDRSTNRQMQSREGLTVWYLAMREIWMLFLTIAMRQSARKAGRGAGTRIRG